MAERCECTTTMSQLFPNSGVTNGDCNGEMTSVRDNGATNNDYITTTLRQHFCKNWNIFFISVWEKNEIDWSCDKWTGYKRLWFHSYFIILSIAVSHHYGSSSQTTTCPGIDSARWSTEYCSTPASASTRHLSAQVEAAATMVVSTVVAKMTSVWEIQASYGGTEDWRSGRLPKLCQLWTCFKRWWTGWHPWFASSTLTTAGAAPRTEGGHRSPLHGYRGQFQKFTVWFLCGIQHYLFAHSWGHFCHIGHLPWRGHRNVSHSWRLDGHCQQQQPQVAVPSLPWGNGW